MDKDFNREEGVYVTEIVAGLPPYTVRLFKIERVNGNDTVTVEEITESEAKDMVAQFARMGIGRILSDIDSPLAGRPDPA